MHHSRKTVKKYNKHNEHDERHKIKCSFCDTLNDDLIIESTETIDVIANRVAYDYFEGLPTTGEHYLIVPKRHVIKFIDFTDQERKETFELLSKYEDKGFNVYARSTRNIHRSREHQHTHLIKLTNKEPKLIVVSSKPYFVLHI